MEQKIPKIIHYCWLSGEEKPESIQKCIDSWSEFLPDYEIICWDMERFDITSVPFVKSACKVRKWPFAADYIRLYALYHHGGIYFDSDVMVYQSFDPFLHHSAFSSTQVNPHIFTRQISEGSTACVGMEAAVLGAIPKHPWIKELLDFYKDKKFENTETFKAEYVMTNVVARISAAKFNFKYTPIYQILDHDVHIYPPDVFSIISEPSPIKYSTHWCANSWVDYSEKPKYSMMERIKGFVNDRILGKKKKTKK